MPAIVTFQLLNSFNNGISSGSCRSIYLQGDIFTKHSTAGNYITIISRKDSMHMLSASMYTPKLHVLPLDMYRVQQKLPNISTLSEVP
jgi:hypothetical protein